MIASADVAGTAQIFTARLMGDTNNSTDMVHLMITNEAVAPEAKASASCDGDNKQQQQQQVFICKQASHCNSHQSVCLSTLFLDRKHET